VGSVLLAGAFLVAAVFIDALPADPLPYRPGQYLPHDIYARISFRVLSEDLKEELLRQAAGAEPPVFRLNTSVRDEILTALKNLPDQLKVTTQPSDLDERLAKRFNLSADSTPLVRQVLTDPAGRAKYQAGLRKLADELAGTYIVRQEALRPRLWRSANEALFVADDRRQKKNISDLISLTEQGKIADRLEVLASPFDPAVRPHVRACLENILAKGQPIYVFDASLTQKNIEQAQRAIEANPPDEAYKRYSAGQLLVRQSIRRGSDGTQIKGLSQLERRLLAEEHLHYLQSERRAHPSRRWGRVIGRGAVLALVTLLLCLYVAHWQRRIVKNHWRGLALALVLLLMVGLAKSTVFGLEFNVYSAMFAVVLATIVFTIAYDQRFSLAIGAVLSLLIVVVLRQDFAMLLVLLSGAAAAAFQLREIRTRSKVIAASAITAVIALTVTCAVGLVAGTPWKFVLTDGAWAAGTALLAGMFAQVVLPLIERAFRIATSLTLLEWCDASKPLLKRLATEAPGTWNHCLQLGAMCEAAANAIGARGLMARVGAYYHDIGKINKPDYFVENQGEAPSKHEKLSPAMSLLIIVGHVKDGLEMAKEYSLPTVLHQFIATHHGTTLVQYFYHAAAEQRKGDVDRAPEEVEFRYPGPKPRIKEAGILMLADAAESSVRAMSEPTAARIESQVRSVVNRRLMDGQLDECEMTLREVHQVEASLTKSLCSIYHARISYPAPVGQNPSSGNHSQAKGKGEPQSHNQRPPHRPAGAGS